MREDAVLISVSQNAQIYNNLLEANFGGIEYFLNCGSFSEGFDLRNNAAYDNTIVVGTQSYAYASGFSHLSQCTSTQLAPYLNGDEEPHLLPQHVPCAVTLFYSVLSLGRLEGLESVAGTGVHDVPPNHCRMSAAA